MFLQEPSTLHVEFSEKVRVLAVAMEDIINETRRKSPKTETEVQAWADKWVENAGEFVEKLMDLTDKVHNAELLQNVDWRENDKLINLIIKMISSMNQITDSMYSIQNQITLQKIDARKKLLEIQLKKEKTEEELRKKEAERRLLAQREEIRQKELVENERLDEHIRQLARAKALKDHELLLKRKKAKQALDEECGISGNNDTSTISEAPAEHVILEDYADDRRKKRRSRSLGRRIISSVKKTVKRSISTVNHMIEIP